MSSKTKKFLLYAGAIFGGVCFLAAFLRAQAMVKADSSGTTKLPDALGAQIKIVTQFK